MKTMQMWCLFLKRDIQRNVYALYSFFRIRLCLWQTNIEKSHVHEIILWKNDSRRDLWKVRHRKSMYWSQCILSLSLFLFESCFLKEPSVLLVLLLPFVCLCDIIASLSFTTNDQKVRQISDARIRRGLCQSRQEEETKDFERLKVFVMSRHDSRRRDKNLKPRNPVSVDPQRRLHTQDVQLDRSSKLTLEGLCDGNNHVSSVLNPEMDVQWSSCSSFRASMKDLSSTSFLDD